MQTCSACTALIRKTQISARRPFIGKICGITVTSYSGERAVSFKKVSLPELLLVAPKATMASQVPCLIKILT